MNVTASTNQHKTARRVQGMLRKNPYDIDALLQLAILPGNSGKPDLDQKRKLLHRILYLEPAHKQARQMLFEMDRLAIGGDVSRLSAAVILTDPAWDYPPEKPLVLKHSIVHRFLVYAFLACMLFAGLSLLRQIEVLATFAAVLLIPLWFLSAVIEISEAGLGVSHLFGLVRTEIPWSDIKELKQARRRKGIKIVFSRGRAVAIPATIQGYPFVLDILRQTRPDLLHEVEAAGIGEPYRSPAIPSLSATTLK